MGETVKHRSRVARDPTQPNLRQVYLIHAELFEELCEAGFDIAPGQMGENVTTSGLDLLELPTGTLLRLGEAAVIEVTGLRNPCAQLDRIQPEGLGRPPSLRSRCRRKPVLKAGIMGIVVAGGEIRPGDAVQIDLPALPHIPLAPV
jgi:MOSC domain-containing protein YiiM